MHVLNIKRILVWIWYLDYRQSSFNESVEDAEKLVKQLEGLSISRNSSKISANTLQSRLPAAVRVAIEQTNNLFKGMIE